MLLFFTFAKLEFQVKIVMPLFVRDSNISLQDGPESKSKPKGMDERTSKH